MSAHDQALDARDFLEHHHVRTLFEELTTALVHHRPAEPKRFLIEALQVMLDAEASGEDHVDLCSAIGSRSVKHPSYSRNSNNNNSNNNGNGNGNSNGNSNGNYNHGSAYGEGVPQMRPGSGRSGRSGKSGRSSEGYKDLPSHEPKERIGSNAAIPPRGQTPPLGFGPGEVQRRQIDEAALNTNSNSNSNVHANNSNDYADDGGGERMPVAQGVSTESRVSGSEFDSDVAREIEHYESKGAGKNASLGGASEDLVDYTDHARGTNNDSFEKNDMNPPRAMTTTPGEASDNLEDTANLDAEAL